MSPPENPLPAPTRSERRISNGLTVAAWLLFFGIFVPLSVSAVLDLADDHPCTSRSADVDATAADRSWVPPEVRCRYTYPDGTITESERNYWAVFVPTVALGAFATYQTVRWVRRRGQSR